MLNGRLVATDVDSTVRVETVGERTRAVERERARLAEELG
jgi:hypothetical protein